MKMLDNVRGKSIDAAAILNTHIDIIMQLERQLEWQSDSHLSARMY